MTVDVSRQEILSFQKQFFSYFKRYPAHSQLPASDPEMGTQEFNQPHRPIQLLELRAHGRSVGKLKRSLHKICNIYKLDSNFMHYYRYFKTLHLLFNSPTFIKILSSLKKIMKNLMIYLKFNFYFIICIFQIIELPSIKW